MEINRRRFLEQAAFTGISASGLASLLAACGGDGEVAATSTSGSSPETLGLGSSTSAGTVTSKAAEKPVRKPSGHSPKDFFHGTRCALRSFAGGPAYSASDSAKYSTGNNASQTGINNFQAGSTGSGTLAHFLAGTDSG